MTNADDGRAERLAPWIRALPLDQQVLITSTTLVLEKINTRRGDSLPFPVDEVALRETADPHQAALLAREISNRYAGLEPVFAPDGTDENWRISNMAKVVADTIDRNFPATGGTR